VLVFSSAIFEHAVDFRKKVLTGKRVYDRIKSVSAAQELPILWHNLGSDRLRAFN